MFFRFLGFHWGIQASPGFSFSANLFKLSTAQVSPSTSVCIKANGLSQRLSCLYLPDQQQKASLRDEMTTGASCDKFSYINIYIWEKHIYIYIRTYAYIQITKGKRGGGIKKSFNHAKSRVCHVCWKGILAASLMEGSHLTKERCAIHSSMSPKHTLLVNACVLHFGRGGCYNV